MIEIFDCPPPHYVPAHTAQPKGSFERERKIFSNFMLKDLFNPLMNDKWIISFAPASQKDRSDLYLFCPLSSSLRAHNPEILSRRICFPFETGNNGWWQLITVTRLQKNVSRSNALLEWFFPTFFSTQKKIESFFKGEKKEFFENCLWEPF